MTGPTPPAVTVVTCPSCHGGGRETNHHADSGPVSACDRCGGAGKRRAQFVLTVANLDTGAVASASIVPGAVAPTRTDDGRFWCLDLAPVVADLAARVGAADLYDPEMPDDQIFTPWTQLAKSWQPDLPADQRHALEAEAIAAEAYDPWRIWYGRSAATLPREPARRLGDLCDLAEQLCLDLVVEARRSSPTSDTISWDIRFELPGSPVPGGTGRWLDLTEAASLIKVSRACYDLIDRSRHAPAHHVTPRVADNGTSIGAPRIDFDQLERRVLADCTALLTGEPNPGAQAIWRDGRWWHTTLRATDASTGNSGDTGGYTAIGTGGRLVRSWQPPPPSWQGPPIPFWPCPDCAPRTPDLRDCDCHRIGGCRTCGGTHRIYHGATVTIAAGRRRVRHLNWPPIDGTATAAPAPLGVHPNGKPTYQMPPEYRLTQQLTALGLDPAELRPLDDATMILREHELLHGYATVHRPGRDPLTTYLENVTAGLPGGRILVRATAPQVPSLATVVTLAYALGLTLIVDVADHRHNAGVPYLVQGLHWGVRFAPPGITANLSRPSPTMPNTVHHPSLAQAIAYALAYIRNGSDAAVPTDPTTPVPAPHATPAADLTPHDAHSPDDDPVPLLTALAAHYPGSTLSVLLTTDRCTIHLPDGRPSRRLIATGATLAEAVAIAVLAASP
ncbi:hypothetical protein ACN27F_21605 [Solwaraspora sp. WMMB335]|uniref:hypothetical protein n=1 Tax=Solwaraspora sp. WMMB335 TaxID=3404118 RepID=UPI003B9656FE